MTNQRDICCILFQLFTLADSTLINHTQNTSNVSHFFPENTIATVGRHILQIFFIFWGAKVYVESKLDEESVAVDTLVRVGDVEEEVFLMVFLKLSSS